MRTTPAAIIFLALVLSANALNLDDNIVDDGENLLYDAITNVGNLWQHFKQTTVPVMKAKIVCVETYAQMDYNIVRDGSAEILKCVHTTSDQWEKLQSSKFGQKRIANFRSSMQSCQSKITHASLRLDCYSDVITYYANMLDLIKVPYKEEAKLCINLSLQLIDRKLDSARDTYAQCMTAAAPDTPQPAVAAAPAANAE